MEQWLPRFSVTRPVTVVMVFLALTLLGFIAWDRIPLEMMPGKFTLNRMWVWVPYQGASPREVEASLLRPIEEQISTAPGLKSMRGRARDSGVSLSLEFHRSVSMDVAYNSVVDRMERTMPDLPDDVERYWVYKWNPSDEPVVWSGISLPDDIEDPHGLVNDVVAKRLERVPGVGKVDVWGVDPSRVFVEFSLDALSSHNVNLGEVIGSLAQDNFQLASGRVVDDGRVRYVRSLARWQSVDEIRAIPIKPGVTVGDIADVQYRPDPSPDIRHIDGNEGAALAINKESDANTVAVTSAVEEAFAELERDPRLKGARFVVFFNQGELISNSVNDLLMTALTGGICAIIVLFAFLREWKLTLLIAACIPFTLLLTVTVLYFRGSTLNLLTLMGLMLAVGMVVDNAIVVVESIYARRQRGEVPKRAAILGASEVVLAITLSTLTTMVVFLPIILMSEDADFSFFMGELGMPVVWALGASLLVAVIFTPLTTTLLKGGAQNGGLKVEPRWITWLAQRYQRGVRWVLTHRVDAMMGLVAITVLTFVLPVKSVGCQDEAEGNVGQFVVRFQVPPDLSYRDRLEIVETFETWAEDHRDEWGIRTHRSDLDSGSDYGRLNIHLTEEDERPADMPTRQEVIKIARGELPRMPGVDAQIGWGGNNQGQNTQIEVNIRGDDVGTLETLGEEVRRVLRGLPGVITASTDLEDGAGQELRLRADREALARYGQSARSIGQTVGFALRGTQLPDYHDNNKEVDVVARFRYEDREDLDRLLDFPMWSATGSVPLRSLVDPEVAPGFGTIRRTDRITSFPLTVELEPDADPMEVRGAITGALNGMAWPRGYTWDFYGSGPTNPENDTARNLALVLSITFVFLIMGVLFESFLLPLSIITSIPMALFGVYWTLYLTRTPLDVMGGVGLVILIGVVVNNGIVLIDLVTRLRADGMSRTDALVEAGGRRLRPILMTALTTIFGLLPMALGTSTFIGIPYAPMGRVVAGGMVAGTLLTLFFVPFMYTVLDDAGATSSRWTAWVFQPLLRRSQARTAK